MHIQDMQTRTLAHNGRTYLGIAGQVVSGLMALNRVMYAASRPRPAGEGSNPVSTANTPLLPRTSSSPSGRMPKLWSVEFGAGFRLPLHVTARLVHVSLPN